MWQGFGVLVPVIAFGALLIVGGIYEAEIRTPEGATFGFMMAALVSALATLLLALGIKRRDRIIADELPAGTRLYHDFLGIPVRCGPSFFSLSRRFSVTSGLPELTKD